MRKLLLSAIGLALLSAGCTRRVYLPVEREHSVHDSVMTAAVLRDSVTIRDSIVIRAANDTVTREVWRFRERLSRGGAVRIQSVHDTVRIPVITEVERIRTVERQPSHREQIEMSIGRWAILLIIIIVLTFIIKRKLS